MEYIWQLMRHTFSSKFHPALYKVKGQFGVSGLWSSSAAVALKSTHKYLHGDNHFYTNNSNSFLR